MKAILLLQVWRSSLGAWVLLLVFLSWANPLMLLSNRHPEALSQKTASLITEYQYSRVKSTSLHMRTTLQLIRGKVKVKVKLWMYSSIFSWLRHYLEVSGQLHASAALLPRGRSLRYTLDWRLGEPPSPQEKILDPTGTRTPTPRSSSP
jgi:hypothetical protein